MVVAIGDIGKRVRDARLALRPSMRQGELARRVEVSQARLGNWERGAHDPPPDLIPKLAAELRVSVAFLYGDAPHLTGIGPSAATPPAPGGDADRAPQPGVGRRFFPLVGAASAASFPISPGDVWHGDYVEFSDDLFREDRFAIAIRGDSMYPRLEHGDYVLVQPSSRVERGLLAIAHRDHEYTCKVLALADGGSMELRPINGAYDPIPLGDGWQLVGYAVGLRRERGRGRYLEEGDNQGLRP